MDGNIVRPRHLRITHTRTPRTGELAGGKSQRATYILAAMAPGRGFSNFITSSPSPMAAPLMRRISSGAAGLTTRLKQKVVWTFWRYAARLAGRAKCGARLTTD